MPGPGSRTGQGSPGSWGGWGSRESWETGSSRQTQQSRDKGTMGTRGAQGRQGCKGCDDSYRLTEQQIARAVAALEAEPGRCVPHDVYQERLNLCSSCEKQQLGTTCSLCGCVIRVAAKLRERSCPLPGGGRWSVWREERDSSII